MFGSVLRMLCRSTEGAWTMGARDSAQNMDTLWDEINETNKAEGIRDGFSEIKESMFVPTTTNRLPKLKGKATDVRQLGKPLLAILEK